MFPKVVSATTSPNFSSCTGIFPSSDFGLVRRRTFFNYCVLLLNPRSSLTSLSLVVRSTTSDDFLQIRDNSRLSIENRQSPGFTNSTATMAKDKETKLSKEERKAVRKAEKKTTKEEAGVKKPKSDKKEKKEKRKVLAEKALNEVEGKKAKKAAKQEDESSEDEDEDGDVEVKDAESEASSEDEKAAAVSSAKATSARPVGALVPFANPLADDKVAKKVFKSVKKGW